jgi:hypothetical protein
MHSQLAVCAAIQAAFHAPPVERLLTEQSIIRTGENRERPHFLGDVTREVSPVSNYQRPKWHQMRYTHTHRDNKNSLPCSRAPKILVGADAFLGEERKNVFLRRRSGDKTLQTQSTGTWFSPPDWKTCLSIQGVFFFIEDTF